MLQSKMWVRVLFVGVLAIGATNAPTATAASAPRARRAAGALGTKVVVDGKTLPSSVRVDLVAATVDVVEYKSGNKASVIYKNPGVLRGELVKLEGTGVMPKMLQGWWSDIASGKVTRKKVAVSTTISGKLVTTHQLDGAFPSGLSVDPAANTWTLTLAYNRVEFFQ